MSQPVDTSLLLKAAAAFLEVGLSVIPVHRDKTPCGPWKAFQTQRATLPEIAARLRDGAEAIALVCGSVSGNLEMLDFDCGGEIYPAWVQLVEQEAPGLFARLVIERSQSGGWHALYRCPGTVIPGNAKLALRAVCTPDAPPVAVAGKMLQPTGIDGRHVAVVTLLETRGEGGYFLCAPSPGYTLMQGHISRPTTITPEEREVLLRTARSLTEWADPRQARGFTRSRLPSVQEQPGEAYNRRGDLRGLLARHGWTACGQRGDIEYWRRPGKPTGISASLLGGAVFYVFSTNAAPFAPACSYSPFGVYTALEHADDFRAAAKALAMAGYGRLAATPPQALPATGPANAAPAPTSGAWALARELFPRRPFPWTVFPVSIAESLRQLARACAG